MKRSARWWLASLLPLALMACASQDEEGEEPPPPEQALDLKEPSSGLPDAPPLGAPHAKLAPEEVLKPDEED